MVGITKLKDLMKNPAYEVFIVEYSAVHWGACVFAEMTVAIFHQFFLA
jgi:hypothetical protein